MVVYASMTTSGFITSPSEIAVEKLNDYMATNASQSNVIPNGIRSLSDTVAKNPNDMIGLAAKVEDDLTDLLGKYLTGLSVEVRADEVMRDSLGTGIYDLTIDVMFDTSNGISTLKRAITVNGNKLSKSIQTEIRLND